MSKTKDDDVDANNFLDLGLPLTFLGTTGSHFLAIERIMKKNLTHKSELELEIKKIKKRN